MTTKILISNVGLIQDLTVTDVRSITDSILLSAEYVIDPNTLNRFLYDAFAVNESAVLQFSKQVADPFNVADLSVDITFTKGLADNQPITENFSRSVQYSRNFTEAFSTADQPTLLFTSVKTDQFAITDVENLTVGKNISENQLITDVFSVAFTYNRTFNDAFTLDDAATVDAFSREDQLAKTNVFSFTETQAFGVTKAPADTFTVAEAITVFILPKAAINAAPLNFTTLN